MQTVNEERLETDLGYRFGWVSEFMGFGAAEIDRIHQAAPLLAPHVPGLVDAVYDKLFRYTSTLRHFVPRQSGYSGVTPESLSELTQDHAMIQFRKSHLTAYLVALVTKQYDLRMVEFLNRVGAIHTPLAGSPNLHVPLVQMNALMGFVADALLATICQLGLDRTAEVETLRAFSKLLWLQNDLITRHYQQFSAAEALPSEQSFS